MEFLMDPGLPAAVLMGAVLGLIGGGGSILTVPILVYLSGIDATRATAYSLFVVGTAALAGMVPYARRGQVAFRTGALFAAPALAAVYGVRRFVMPSLPDVILAAGGITVTRDLLLLGLFAVLMVVASYFMIRGGSDGEREQAPGDRKGGAALVVIEGVVVGSLTGLVGAGGGFLIIPALVNLLGLPMKTAVGTSLLIIAIKSLLGFTGDFQAGMAIDWAYLGAFTGFALVGILAGTALSSRVSGALLKKGFGWFALAAGAAMLVRELAAL